MATRRLGGPPEARALAMADGAPHTLVMGPPPVGSGGLHRSLHRVHSGPARPISPGPRHRRRAHPPGNPVAGTPIHVVPGPVRSRFRALWPCRRGVMEDENNPPPPACRVGCLRSGGKIGVRVAHWHPPVCSCGTRALPARALGPSDWICRRTSRRATDALGANTPACTVLTQFAKHISSSSVALVIAPPASRRLALAFLATSGHCHRFSDPVSRLITSTQLP